MYLRLLAILMLLLPTIQFAGMLVLADGTESHGRNCQMVVEESSCCGAVQIQEADCPMSVGNDCQCAAVAPKLPEAPPVTPRPLTLGDLLLGVPESSERISLSVSDDQPPACAIAFESKRSLPSHNIAQAILGIWRI